MSCWHKRRERAQRLCLQCWPQWLGARDQDCTLLQHNMHARGLPCKQLGRQLVVGLHMQRRICWHYLRDHQRTLLQRHVCGHLLSVVQHGSQRANRVHVCFWVLVKRCFFVLLSAPPPPPPPPLFIYIISLSLLRPSPCLAVFCKPCVSLAS